MIKDSDTEPVFRIQGSGFMIKDSDTEPVFRIQGSGFMSRDSGHRSLDLELRIQTWEPKFGISLKEYEFSLLVL